MNDDLVRAIATKHRVRFVYNGTTRTAEPQCYGIGTKGTELLRAHIVHARMPAALFDLASESGIVTAVEGDLDNLDQALRETPDLGELIRNPEVSREAAGRAIAAVADLLSVAALTKNFLGVLAENRRLSKLPQVISAFHAIAAAARGEVTAEVASAHPLSDDQFEQLRQKLAAREGRSIKLRARVDPELLGGLVVTVGSKRIDSSIRTRLNTLALAMKG